MDPVVRRLVEGVQRRVRWLSGVPTSRMVPTLTKFARAGWQPSDVDRAAHGVLAARGWRLPRELQHPAAYLAGLLRDVDPADRPGAVDELLAERDRAQRAYERRLIYGPPCPHGKAAGNELSPARGLMACPACRSELAAAAQEIVGW